MRKDIQKAERIFVAEAEDENDGVVAVSVVVGTPGAGVWDAVEVDVRGGGGGGFDGGA